MNVTRYKVLGIHLPTNKVVKKYVGREGLNRLLGRVRESLTIPNGSVEVGEYLWTWKVDL